MIERGRGGCCVPVRDATAGSRPAEPAVAVARPDAAELVALDGGWFRMGSDDAYSYEEDGEGPVRSVRVDPFRIAAGCVSNRQFSEFVEATRYVTAAER